MVAPVGALAFLGEMVRVLVVDADRGLLTARGDELAADAFEPALALSAGAARQKLPGADAMILGRLESAPAVLALLRELRAGQIRDGDPDLPVITLGADRDHELVRHYQAGADIALPGDASPLLITASLHALSARAQRHNAQRQVQLGNLTVGLDSGVVKVDDRQLALTNREFEVLCVLARDPAAVTSKQKLLGEVWQGIGCSRAPDTIIARLRERLRAAGTDVTIANQWGRGWQLATSHQRDLVKAAFPAPAASTAPAKPAHAAARAQPLSSAKARKR